MPLLALEMLIRAGVKRGTRASTRSSSRRCVLPRAQPLALSEFSVDDHARGGYEVNQYTIAIDSTTAPRCPICLLLPFSASLYSMDMVRCVLISAASLHGSGNETNIQEPRNKSLAWLL